jgi:hypothetical protein
MTSATDASPENVSPAARPPARVPARWILATVVTLCGGLPIGWLLATAALLPFYLGLFFFALFGLLLGAVQFRIGSPAAPISRWALWFGGILVVITTWTLAMGIEYLHLYSDAVRFVKESHRMLTPEQVRQVEADTPARIRERLAADYPPGGVAGYMQWAARSGEMAVSVTPGGFPLTFRLRQRPFGFVLRVVISVILLAFGLFSQIGSLTAAAARQASPAAPDGSPPPGAA